MTEGQVYLLDSDGDIFVDVVPSDLANTFNAGDVYTPSAGNNNFLLTPILPTQFTRLEIVSTIQLDAIRVLYESNANFESVGFAVRIVLNGSNDLIMHIITIYKFSQAPFELRSCECVLFLDDTQLKLISRRCFEIKESLNVLH